jgi:hypothetical protein
MKSCRTITILLLLLAGLLLARNAQAEVWHRTTRVSINEPIDIPGMVLLPGTYTFTVFNPGTHIVQIWNADETHLYTSIVTIPDYRAQPTEHTVLQLNETSKDAPPELRAWFYPGDNTGHEFVYPARQAEQKTLDHNKRQP